MNYISATQWRSVVGAKFQTKRKKRKNNSKKLKKLPKICMNGRENNEKSTNRRTECEKMRGKKSTKKQNKSGQEMSKN